MMKKPLAFMLLAFWLCSFSGWARAITPETPQEEYDTCVGLFEAHRWLDGEKHCLDFNQYKSARELNETYARVMESLPPARRAQVEKAHAAWEEYQQAYLDLLYSSGSIGEGGSMFLGTDIREYSYAFDVWEMESQIGRLAGLLSPPVELIDPESLSDGCAKCLSPAGGDQAEVIARLDLNRENFEKTLARYYKKMEERDHPEIRLTPLRNAYQSWERFREAYARVLDYPPGDSAAQIKMAEWRTVFTCNMLDNFRVAMDKSAVYPDAEHFSGSSVLGD